MNRHILHVVGTRPNFMKAAPVIRALANRPGIRQDLLHSGQHYDDNMSKVFFDELDLPRPDQNLGVGPGSHAEQTARIMMRFEQYVLGTRPDLVLVYGDVNSTVATALVCAKLLIPVGHVEAGLRSFDRAMPEEINRLLTDQIADLLFTPSPDGDENLLREGVIPEKIHRVGNVMIDTLIRLLPAAEARWSESVCGDANGGISELRSGIRGPRSETPDPRSQALTPHSSLRTTPLVPPYCLVTLHRPSNVDDPVMLRRILAALGDIARSIPVLFPVHPRTRAALRRARCSQFTVHGGSAEPAAASFADGGQPSGSQTHSAPGFALSSLLSTLAMQDPAVRPLPPLGYLDFLALQVHATMVITDSGGIQEETTCLGIPCLTLRENTERPITVTMGTNTMIGRDMDLLRTEVAHVLRGGGKKGTIPPLWDGRAGERIATIISR